MWPVDSLTGEQENYSRKLEVNIENGKFNIVESNILGWINIPHA